MSKTVNLGPDLEFLRAQERQFYKENGYLIIENVLRSGECGEYIQEAERLAQGYYCNMLDLLTRSEKFRALIRDDRILQRVDYLQEARMIPIGSIFFFCMPQNPLENGSLPHQDNYAAKSPYGSYFVCGVALDEADEENGSLVVYPKTHLLGELPSVASKNFEFDHLGRINKAYPIGNQVSIPEGYGPVTLRYPRGSLIFMHGHLVHYAPKNPSSSRWRRKIYLHFIKDGDPFWPGWNARRQIFDRGD